MGNSLRPEFSTKEEYEWNFVKRDVFRKSIFGGSKGLGDPDDKYLYRYERKFNLPRKRKQIIFEEYCSKPNEDCRKRHKFLHKFRCNDELIARRQCLHQFWDSPGLEERTYNEYLANRSHYRHTGASQRKPSIWNIFSIEFKSWEEYQSTRKQSKWSSLKEGLSMFFSKKLPPDDGKESLDLSGSSSSEHLNDS